MRLRQGIRGVAGLALPCFASFTSRSVRIDDLLRGQYRSRGGRLVSMIEAPNACKVLVDGCRVSAHAPTAFGVWGIRAFDNRV